MAESLDIHGTTEAFPRVFLPERVDAGAHRVETLETPIHLLGAPELRVKFDETAAIEALPSPSFDNAAKQPGPAAVVIVPPDGRAIFGGRTTHEQLEGLGVTASGAVRVGRSRPPIKALTGRVDCSSCATGRSPTT